MRVKQAQARACSPATGCSVPTRPSVALGPDAVRVPRVPGSLAFVPGARISSGLVTPFGPVVGAWLPLNVSPALRSDIKLALI